MRKVLLASFLVAFAAACGSSSKGGGGGGSLTGTVGGHAFSPMDVEAISAGSGSTPCAVPLGGGTVDVGVKALALQITSYANACGDYTTAQCKFHQGAQSVTILFARLNPAGTEPPLLPGTYTVNSSATTVTPDGATGMLLAAYAQALATNATCAGTPSGSIQGGTLRLDTVTSPITGHVSLTFVDGSSLSGDFSAPICAGVSPDVCALATAQALCTLPPLCVP